MGKLDDQLSGLRERDLVASKAYVGRKWQEEEEEHVLATRSLVRLWVSALGI